MTFVPRLLLPCLLAVVLLGAAAGPAAAAPATEGPAHPRCLAVGPHGLCPGAFAQRTVKAAANAKSRAAARARKRAKAGKAGAKLLRAARSYLGTPYAWGGESRGGLDCSGLVVVSFRALGRSVPHYSGALWTMGRKVPKTDLKPGDLVFFRLSGGVPGHVGIYAGKGRYIHAPSSGGVVRYGLMSDRADDYAGARRVG